MKINQKNHRLTSTKFGDALRHESNAVVIRWKHTEDVVLARVKVGQGDTCFAHFGDPGDPFTGRMQPLDLEEARRVMLRDRQATRQVPGEISASS